MPNHLTQAAETQLDILRIDRIQMHIQAFRGLRYDLGHVGSLSEVVAPAAEAIDAEERDELYERHPANVVRLISNRDEPGDDEYSSPILRAERFLKSWRSQSLLVHEADPAVYVYHQTYEVAGVRATRRSFICRVRLESLGDDCIHASQQTNPTRVKHWQRLTQACRADLSPVVAIYADAENEAQEILESAILGQTPLEAAPDGLHINVDEPLQSESSEDTRSNHRLWPVTDVNVIAEFAAAIASRTTVLVEGNARYQAALDEQAKLHRDSDNVDRGHPANFVLMHGISCSERDLALSTPFRLFTGLAASLQTEQLHAALSRLFTCRDVGVGIAGGDAVRDQLVDDAEATECGLFVPGDQRWTIARATADGLERLRQLYPDRSTAWRQSSLNVVQCLVAESVFGLSTADSPESVESSQQLCRRLNQLGTDAAKSFVAVVRPPSIERLRACAERGERLPAETVRLAPSPIHGLVFNAFDA